jgi:hypothetical protein
VQQQVHTPAGGLPPGSWAALTPQHQQLVMLQQRVLSAQQQQAAASPTSPACLSPSGPLPASQAASQAFQVQLLGAQLPLQQLPSSPLAPAAARFDLSSGILLSPSAAAGGGLGGWAAQEAAAAAAHGSAANAEELQLQLLALAGLAHGAPDTFAAAAPLSGAAGRAEAESRRMADDLEELLCMVGTGGLHLSLPPQAGTTWVLCAPGGPPPGVPSPNDRLRPPALCPPPGPPPL